jgi:hypothetical protein
MLLRDALERVLGNGNVEEKRGSSGDLIAQVTFDLEFHVNGDAKNRSAWQKLEHFLMETPRGGLL